MGGNATYSNILLKASYTAVEAHQQSYDIQRLFFGKLADKSRPYLDVLAAESMELAPEKLENEILSNKYAIKQIAGAHPKYRRACLSCNQLKAFAIRRKAPIEGIYNQCSAMQALTG